MSLRAAFFGLNQVPPPEPPDAPATLTAAPTGTNNLHVGLTWAASTGAAGYILEYDDGGGWDEIADTASLSYTHTTPLYGIVTHSYRVRAYNGNGESANATATQKGRRVGGVGSWTLNESSGTRSDSIGANHFTEPSASVGSATGKLGNGANITGVNDRLEITSPGAVLQFSGSFTIAIWFYLDSAVPGEATILIYNYNGGWWIRHNGTSYRARVSGTEIETTIAAGEWYRGVLLYDAVAGEARSYLNGTLIGTESVAAPSWSGAIMLGSDAFSWMDGIGDQIDMVARAWSAAEIAEDFNAGAGVAYPS